MFTASKEVALAALDHFGSRACMYGTWPDGMCDCKYGVGQGGSEQTGCPELRTIRQLVVAMDDEEWAMLERRAEGTPSGSFAASAEDIRIRFHRADTQARRAAEHIASLRDLLTLEREPA